ncbi:coiled-coil domain-containing protein [Phaeocystidibacter luteus]|uniref:Chromosome segregation protein SMC n=1 Tax=Phaeocystidibacter luteus TaxID=911197 RepID=A0A6N6RJU6_9FLAO|nr:hypothetical protein [Phaeocystidibacter luteus]KAB2813980.1 hypothetical protein F8C67_04665 [Phaeocystidibacter luteus]
MSEQATEKKKSNKGLVALVIILLLVIAGMGYLLFDKEATIEDQSTELASIEADLKSSLESISMLESSNDSMDAYIVNREAYLEALLDSVQDAKNATDAQLARWKNNTYSLRRQVAELEGKVDSIEKAYEALSIENAETKVNLAQQIEDNDDLRQSNQELSDDVVAGSRLQLTAINAGAYKVSSGGEEDETDRARRAERVKGCITIGANAIAEKGEREVIMRVITPEKKVLTAAQDSTGQGSNQFSVNGNNLFFTAKKTVWYENENTNVCLTFDFEDFAEGTYMVEIYIDGALTQEARFVLD